MNNELQHYGVLGMKWGVRRGKTTKAYQKASKKAAKIDKRILEQESEMNKRIAKADKKASSVLAREKSIAKAESKAREATAEYRKVLRKGERWYKAMEDTFKNTDVSLSSAQVEAGKRYAQTLRMYSMSRY